MWGGKRGREGGREGGRRRKRKGVQVYSRMRRHARTRHAHACGRGNHDSPQDSDLESKPGRDQASPETASERGWAGERVGGCWCVSSKRQSNDSVTTVASRTCTLIPQGGNNLGPQGAMHLAGALEKMTGMQTLDLVSHVGVRVHAHAGRLVNTGHGPCPGRLEPGQLNTNLCTNLCGHRFV